MNLAALPAHGFTLSCFPVKIDGASAGWIRAVDLMEGWTLISSSLRAQ